MTSWGAASALHGTHTKVTWYQRSWTWIGACLQTTLVVAPCFLVGSSSLIHSTATAHTTTQQEVDWWSTYYSCQGRGRRGGVAGWVSSCSGPRTTRPLRPSSLASCGVWPLGYQWISSSGPQTCLVDPFSLVVPQPRVLRHAHFPRVPLRW